MATAWSMAKGAAHAPTGRLRQVELRLAESTRFTYRESLASQGSGEGSGEVPAGHEDGPGLITGKASVNQEQFSTSE